MLTLSTCTTDVSLDNLSPSVAYLLCSPTVGAGIKRYCDPSVCPSVCLSVACGTLAVWHSCLGYRLAGCLQLRHVQTADPSTDGRRLAMSWTAISGGISSRRPPPRGDNLFTFCLSWSGPYLVVYGALSAATVGSWAMPSSCASDAENLIEYFAFFTEVFVKDEPPRTLKTKFLWGFGVDGLAETVHATIDLRVFKKNLETYYFNVCLK